MSVHTSTAERASSSGEISRKGTADTDDISRKNLEYIDLVSEDCGKHQLSSDIDDDIDNSYDDSIICVLQKYDYRRSCEK